MEIIKISAFALVAAVLSVTIKGQKPEIAIMISIAAGAMILAVASKYLKDIFEVLNYITSKIDLDLSFIEIILKIVAIAYVCEFSSQVCKDAGEGAIASKIELAGKILILFTSAPMILSLLDLLTKII